MGPADEVSLDLPPPIRNFAMMRKTLLVLLVTSVVVPVACLISYAYYDYQRRINDAHEIVDRLTRASAEQAMKVLDLNADLSARVLDLLGRSNDSLIRSREGPLHQRLQEIVAAIPQIEAINVFGSDGTLLASSRYSPVPDVSAAERDFFRFARDLRPSPYISLPVRGKMSGTDVFSTNIGRSARSGVFLGVLSVELREAYFTTFYRELTGGEPSESVGLYRKDGGLLARYPSFGPNFIVTANAEIEAAIARDDHAGHLVLKSTADGVARLLAYRRVDDYPLYTTAGIKITAITAKWRQNLGVIAAIISVPCIAVWIVVLLALRRLRDEQEAWELWRVEIGKRLSAEASNRQLRRMGALGNLVANVAHDFNNLLMVVNANVELARRKRYDNLEKEVLAVKHAASAAQGLARRLMSVARKQPLKSEPIKPGLWLRDVAELVQTSIGDEIKLSVTIIDDISIIMVDPAELEFAVLNLAINAKDAMPRGGTFLLKCESIRFLLPRAGLPAGDYVVLSFTDNGEGMTEAVARRAFEPLYTTKIKGAGTGLGLAQVQTTCEQAGGIAQIDSTVGVGTTVRLYLPRYYGGEELAQAAVPETAPADDDVIPGNTTVLLVEDNESVAAGIAAVLEVLGCTVHHELTADSALDLLTGERRFDLVLSDIQMPGKLNGLDLAETIRKAWPTQRVALMTGYAEELERARRVGIVILAKPFDINELRAMIEARG